MTNQAPPLPPTAPYGKSSPPWSFACVLFQGKEGLDRETECCMVIAVDTENNMTTCIWC